MYIYIASWRDCVLLGEFLSFNECRRMRHSTLIPLHYIALQRNMWHLFHFCSINFRRKCLAGADEVSNSVMHSNTFASRLILWRPICHRFVRPVACEPKCSTLSILWRAERLTIQTQPNDVSAGIGRSLPDGAAFRVERRRGRFDGRRSLIWRSEIIAAELNV